MQQTLFFFIFTMFVVRFEQIGIDLTVPAQQSSYFKIWSENCFSYFCRFLDERKFFEVTLLDPEQN